MRPVGPGTTTSGSGAPGLGALVLGDGAPVQGAGRVSVWRGEAWFESWDVATRLGDESSQRNMPPSPTLGRHAVPLDGVRVDRLHDRQVAGDVVDGLALLTGEWVTRGVRAGLPRLRVTAQDDRLDVIARHWGCSLCALDGRALDVHPARPVRRSRAAVDAAFELLRPRMEALQVTLLGGATDAAGTPVLDVHVARVVPELVALAGRFEADLLHVEPWLRPVGS